MDLLGMVVFGTIVSIGLLDGRRGLSVFALYGVSGRERRALKTDRGGGKNQPQPPTPAR